MTETPGHNSNQQLRSIVERIEHIEDERAQLALDIKDIYTEAKGNGYDAKALRKIIALRKLSPEDRQAQETILETYMSALGML